MLSGFKRLLVAELLGFGAFVFGGLAVVGAVGLSQGELAIEPWLALVLVLVFGVTAVLLAAAAVQHLLGSRRSAAQRAQPAAAVADQEGESAEA